MTSEERTHWNRPEPGLLPPPTYWPAVLALGNTLLLWGILTTWVISLVGLVSCIAGLSGWIHNLLQQPDARKLGAP